MSIPSPRLILYCLLCVCVSTAYSQVSTSLENVIDTAKVFTGDDKERLKAQLEREMADVTLETGVRLIFRTESTATGSTAKRMAVDEVTKSLNASKPGAVMIYIRADDSVGVAVTEGSGEIPDYVFSTVDKAAGARPANLDRSQYALRSAREMIAVFRKYYSPDAGKTDPRKRGDKILMAVMVGGVLVLVFGFIIASRRRRS